MKFKKNMKNDSKIETLRKCFEDVIWMAIRYAHGKHTYAPGMVREAVENYKKIFPDFKLIKDITIELPGENDLSKPFSMKDDYLNDLFEKE